MLLKEIKLHNIRSYSDETISFPEGSILLSGDIGSGKSSILLAIEFALFGTSRPDLPAETLLRKGATQGSVELSFHLQGNEYVIKRNLKKEKDSIAQTNGYLIINNLKKELTPVELKAEILHHLGYPEELLSKNKNYLFRYSVYCPQEEMKLILVENPEIRLDTLRKIFNMDKYKAIRENLQIYLKQLRVSLAVLKVKTAPLEEVKQQQLQIMLQEEKIKEDLRQLQPQLQQTQELLQKEQLELEIVDKEQKIFLELQHQMQLNRTLKQEKLSRLEKIRLQESQVVTEKARLPHTDESPESIVQRLKEIEVEKNSLLDRRSTLTEKRKNIQKVFLESREEVLRLQEQLSLKEAKEQLLVSLAEELKSKGETEERRAHLDGLLEKTMSLMAKNQAILQQSLETIQKISSLDQCPTCLQKVSADYRENIIKREQHNLSLAENLLFESKKNKMEIMQQREHIQQKKVEYIQKENLLSRTQLELKQLGEKEKRVEQLHKQRERWENEAQKVDQELQQIPAGYVEQIQQKVQEGQTKLQHLIQHQQLEKQLQELKLQLLETSKHLGSLQEKESFLMVKLSEKQDLSPKITEKRKNILVLQQQEKELSVQQGRWQNSVENMQQQQKVVTENIHKIMLAQAQLFRSQELNHWLEEFFFNLTYTIEKQVMVNIHHTFNHLFQEWFSILIDDEQITSRLDDSFTPVIEQNGYEITFSGLSGGERTSASLAYRLSLNKVINEVIHEIKTKDLLILDEPTDGFSSEQLDKVREVLERLKLKQTIIVSHESKIESFVEKVIRVQKESQNSKVNV